MNKLVNSLEAKDLQNHFHPYTNPKVLMENGPHVISKGDGIYVYDNSGKKFIEGMSGLWCASLGFSEKQLADAALKRHDSTSPKRSSGGISEQLHETGSQQLYAVVSLESNRPIVLGVEN